MLKIIDEFIEANWRCYDGVEKKTPSVVGKQNGGERVTHGKKGWANTAY